LDEVLREFLIQGLNDPRTRVVVKKLIFTALDYDISRCDLVLCQLRQDPVESYALKERKEGLAEKRAKFISTRQKVKDLHKQLELPMPKQIDVRSLCQVAEKII